MLRRCHPVTLGLVSGSGEGARRGGDRMNVYGAGECLLANCGGMEGGAVGCQTEVNYLRTGLVIAGWVSTSFSFLYFFFVFAFGLLFLLLCILEGGMEWNCFYWVYPYYSLF